MTSSNLGNNDRCKVTGLRIRRSAWQRGGIDPLTQLRGQHYNFYWEVDFGSGPGESCSCCWVIWQIKWNDVIPRPHIAFPADSTSDTWYEDRGNLNLFRYGHREGDWVNPVRDQIFLPIDDVVDLETGRTLRGPRHTDGYFDIETVGGVDQGDNNRTGGCRYRGEDSPGELMRPSTEGLVYSFRAAVWDNCRCEFVAVSETIDAKYYAREPDFTVADAAFGQPVFSDRIIDSAEDVEDGEWPSPEDHAPGVGGPLRSDVEPDPPQGSFSNTIFGSFN